MARHSETIGERSGILRFFRPWFRSWKSALAALGFLAAAATGFIGTRAATANLKYTRMNPISDKAIVDRIGSGEISGDALTPYLTGGMENAAETLYLPPVIVLKVISAGHRMALSDMLFVRAHAYFLSHFFSDRRFVWLDNYFNAITGLDPDNPKAYLWAAQVLKLGQMIDDETVNRANAYLEQGLTRFPRNWQIHLDLGFNLYFEFKGRDEVEKSAAKLRARDHFATAAGLPGSTIDPNFVAELFERDREDRLAVAYALQKYYEANDDQRSQLLRRISTLSDALATGLKAEEERWRSKYGYLPVAVFALIDNRNESIPAMLAGTGAPASGSAAE